MVINHFAIIILPSLSVNQIIINKAYFQLNEDYYEDIKDIYDHQYTEKYILIGREQNKVYSNYANSWFLLYKDVPQTS